MNGELCEVDTGDGAPEVLEVVDGVLQNKLYGPPENYRVKANIKFVKEMLFDVSFELKSFEHFRKPACKWVISCPRIVSADKAIPCSECAFYKYSNKRITHKEAVSIANNM